MKHTLLIPCMAFSDACSFLKSTTYAALGVGLVVFLCESADAVRPFVTDDARIVDVGQIEFETWLEMVNDTAGWSDHPAYATIVGYSFTEWLEVLAGTSMTYDGDEGLGVENPTLMGKFLFVQSTPQGRPGHAMSISHAFDTGAGSLYEPGHVTSLVGMTSFRPFDDRMQLHFNYGLRSDRTEEGRQYERFYWGVGTEVDLPFMPLGGEKLTWVGEVFAGDPLVPNAPDWAIQTGFRWHYNDHYQVDLVYGYEPELDIDRKRMGYAHSIQIGFRMLFDAFTPGGRSGSAEGARGMFR